jgi:hypothetical protein
MRLRKGEFFLVGEPGNLLFAARIQETCSLWLSWRLRWKYLRRGYRVCTSKTKPDGWE